MADHFGAILARLGLYEYINIFIENGIWSWETIKALKEEDPMELGIKLGHRRVLQRAIAAGREPFDDEFYSEGHNGELRIPAQNRESECDGFAIIPVTDAS